MFSEVIQIETGKCFICSSLCFIHDRLLINQRTLPIFINDLTTNNGLINVTALPVIDQCAERIIEWAHIRRIQINHDNVC